MNKSAIFSRFFAGIILALIMAGCAENNNPLWSNKDAFIFIDQPYYEVDEASTSTTTIRIPIASSPITKDILITFETDTFGFGASGAVEGVDYKIVFPMDKQVKLTAGKAYAFISVAPINNEVMELDNRYFNIRLTSNDKDYPMGIDGSDTTVIAIVDDEHPLKQWFGNYLLTYQSYVNEEIIERTNAIKRVSGSITDVDVRLGYYFDGETYVRGEIDTLMNTISIPYGQAAYNDGENILRVYGTDSILGDIIQDGNLVGDMDPVSLKITFRNPFVLGVIENESLSYEDVYIRPILTKSTN